MKASVFLVVLFVGFVAANFDIPFHFLVGFRQEGEGMINQQIQSAGPFATARNVTLSFYYRDDRSQDITGIEFRGNQRFQVNCIINMINF